MIQHRPIKDAMKSTLQLYVSILVSDKVEMILDKMVLWAYFDLYEPVTFVDLTVDLVVDCRHSLNAAVGL